METFEKPLCYTIACAKRGLEKEDVVEKETRFRQELDAITRELRKSFLKLQSLLEKKRRALKEAEILEDRREREHLEQVIREIERKIREIREIGIPANPPADA